MDKKAEEGVKALAQDHGDVKAVLTESDIKDIIPSEKEKPTQEHGQASGTDEKSFAEKIKGQDADAVRTEFAKVLVNGDEKAVEEAVKAINAAEKDKSLVLLQGRSSLYKDAIKDVQSVEYDGNRDAINKNIKVLGGREYEEINTSTGLSQSGIEQAKRSSHVTPKNDKSVNVGGFGGRG